MAPRQVQKNGGNNNSSNNIEELEMSKLGTGNDIDKFTHYCLKHSDILFHMQKIDCALPHLPLVLMLMLDQQIQRKTILC